MSKYHKYPNIYINEIELKVLNIDRAKEFYTKILGLKVLKEEGRKIALSANEIDPMVTLTELDNAIQKPLRRTGLYHFAILLPTRKDLGLFLNHIKENNYPIVGGAYHGVSEAVYLQDIEDNGIEIYVDLDDKLWERRNGEIIMVTEPLDYNSLMNLAGEEKWKGMPQDAILGHIHLHVADLDQSKRFYCDGLGFNLVTSMANSALFLSTGGYHHHIGLNIWNGKNAPPLPQNSVGMKYFSIVFPSNEIREEKVNNLKKLGYEIMKDNDSVFIKDPSMNLIKLVVY